MATELTELRDQLRVFVADRDWDQFHTPKNLACALSIEAAEVMEHFQWLTEDQSRQLGSEVRSQVADELADVLIYLVRLADKLDIDLICAARRKIDTNAQKYPTEKCRGSVKKYTEL